MTVMLSDVVKKPTVDEQTSAWIKIAASTGMPVGRVSSRSPIYVMAKSVIRLTDYLWTRFVTVGQQLTNIYASNGVWLEILAKGFYDVDKVLKQPAVGVAWIDFTLAGVSSVTLYDSTTGMTFTAEVPAYTSTPTTIQCKFTASEAGNVSNVELGSLVVQSPSSGVAINSTLNNTDLSWITSTTLGGTVGTDDDTDDQLRQKCLDRLALASTGTHAQSLAARVRDATSGVIDKVFYNKATNTCYYASSATGVDVSSYSSIVSTTIDNYLGSETTVTKTPATTMNIFISGYLYLVPGASTDEGYQLLTELGTWLSSQPIYDGKPNTTLLVWDILDAIKKLDVNGIVSYPDLIFYNVSTQATFGVSSPTIPIPGQSTIGTTFALVNISTAYVLNASQQIPALQILPYTGKSQVIR